MLEWVVNVVVDLVCLKLYKIGGVILNTTIYLNDWFYNSGIVGFLRILAYNHDNFAEINENYITFETKKLKNFHKYFFKYFFDKYNVGLKTTERINNSFEKIENYLRIETLDKQEIKKLQENIKTEKKHVKDIIKKQLDKIKKYEDTTYTNILNEYNKIDKIQTKEDIEKIKHIKEIIAEEVQKESINKRLTLNLFKSILSKNYFGQQSFLNVVKNALTFEEQEEIMYKDYISNIIETDFIQEILQEKYTIENLKIILKEKMQDKLISKEVLQIYSNIQRKYIDKGKDLKEIKEYINKKVLSHCYMCENDKALTDDYSEGNFVPLAVSSDNMKNFFWNQNAEFPICDVCKLILFCIPVGVSNIRKTTKENVNGQVVYREKEVNSFVNYDTSVEELLRTNNYLSQTSALDKSTYNPYEELILNIVEQEKNISEWQLENIFIVEFETEYLAFSKMEYFNIKRYIAKFFINYSKNTLSLIKDYRYKIQIMDYILKNKDIKFIINNRLREELTKENRNAFNAYIATKIRLILNLLKKENMKMDERVKKNNDKLYVLYNLGVSIHEELKAKNEDNKIDGYTYKMLNSIKAGNKKEFMDIVIRIHMSMGKDISPIFLEVMQGTDLDFESIGHSFISGLISNKFEKKNEE